MKCVICRRPIPVVRGWAEGNNAEPVAEGRCCYVCDDTVVIPARIRLMQEASKRRLWPPGRSGEDHD